jgi:hypothetical protein
MVRENLPSSAVFKDALDDDALALDPTGDDGTWIGLRCETESRLVGRDNEAIADAIWKEEEETKETRVYDLKFPRSRTIIRTRRITARGRSLGILRMQHGGSSGTDDQMLNRQRRAGH